MAGKATEYIPWPGAGMPPGERTNPGGNKTAPDSKVVHGRYGWEWTEDDSQAAGDVKAAVDAAKGIQRFINISTDQLTVTGTAFINEAIIQKIWTRIITAKEGEFGKLKAGMIEAHRVVADEVKAGAIDGMTITGALIQTKKYGQYPRIAISSDGMYVWDKNNRNTLSINNDGTIWIDGQVGINDSWSWARFVDLYANDTGKDVGKNGRKVGVGIEFQRTNNPYPKSGNITILESAAGEPRLELQAPSRNAAGDPPYFSLSEKGLYFSCGSSWVGIDADRVSITAATGGLRITDGVLKVFTGDDNLIYSDASSFFLRSRKYPHRQFGVMGDDTTWVRCAWDYNCDLRLWTIGNNGGQVASLNARTSAFVVREQAWSGYTFVMEKGAGLYVDGIFGAKGTKTFRIPHPLDPMEKDLIHYCTESPWSGIEYWDTAVLDDSGVAVVALPDYFNALYRPDLPMAVLCSGPGSPWGERPRLGRFTIHGEPGSSVAWVVKAVRREESMRGRTEPIVEGESMTFSRRDDEETVDPKNPPDLRWLYEPPVPTE